MPVKEYHSARVHNCGVLTTDPNVSQNFNSRQPMSSICMDNIGCLNTKTQNDPITNYTAQYPKGTVVQEICYIQEGNDLSVNRTKDDVTDSNYKFMSGQTETKVIHKSGNEQHCYSALAQMTK